MRWLALFIALSLGCTDRTEFGQCVGVADDEDPALLYRVDTWNLVGAIVFFETLVVPAFIVATCIRCPVAKRQAVRP